jgi:hypothetical protein
MTIEALAIHAGYSPDPTTKAAAVPNGNFGTDTAFSYTSAGFGIPYVLSCKLKVKYGICPLDATA